MGADEEHLYRVIEQLIRLRNECSCSVFSECGVPDITVKQIGYLRLIGEEEDMTFSRLARITRTSKPTVTEMINRFVRMDCVYREQSPEDGRVIYIRLTEKGQRIAGAEHDTILRLAERMADSLDEDETHLLVGILRKVR